MTVLQTGGRVEVVGNHLVVSRPKKFAVVDNEHRHVPVHNEDDVVRVKLDDIKDVTFVRATRRGDAGAVMVKLESGTLVLRVLEEDGLRLVAACRQPIRHVKDTDAASSNDEQ